MWESKVLTSYPLCIPFVLSNDRRSGGGPTQMVRTVTYTRFLPFSDPNTAFESGKLVPTGTTL